MLLSGHLLISLSHENLTFYYFAVLIQALVSLCFCSYIYYLYIFGVHFLKMVFWKTELIIIFLLYHDFFFLRKVYLYWILDHLEARIFKIAPSGQTMMTLNFSSPPPKKTKNKNACYDSVLVVFLEFLEPVTTILFQYCGSIDKFL